MSKEVTSKNTKSEIYEAYKELLEEIKENKKEEPQKVQEKAQKEKMSEKSSKLADEAIINGIASLKLNFSSSMDHLEKSLLEEFKKLKEIKESIDFEKENIKELYQIKTEADTLAALLEAQRIKKTSFDGEINELQAQWEKKKKEHAEQTKEEEESIKKQRKREDEDYKYNLETARKKEQDVYDAKKSEQEQQLKTKRETFEKEFAEREIVLKEKEQEFLGLQVQAKKFPEELNIAVEQAKKTVAEELKAKFEFESMLTEKDFKAELKMKDLEIKNLHEKIKSLEETLKQQQQKIENSEKHVKDITIKTIESSAKNNSSYSYSKKTDEQRSE